MKVFMFTDPHLGRINQSHTTSSSRKRFQDHLFRSANSQWKGKARELGADAVFCLGDLFDKSNNPEQIVAQGAAVAGWCDRVLAGNHDLTNRTGSYSSFELLEELWDDGRLVVSPSPGEPYYHVEGSVFWVPHCYTQDVFEKSVREACSAAEGHDGNVYLMLHCSLGSYGEEHGDSSALYLTDELKELVNVAFTRAFVGHEHVPAQEGNITVLGNTFPLGYGEIGDRYAYLLDTDTDKLERILMVKASEVYTKVSISALLERGGSWPAPTPMVEITGEAKWEQSPEIAKCLMQFWKENSDTLFSVKNAVKMEGSLKLKDAFVSNAESYKEALHKAVHDAGFEEELKRILEKLQ